MSNLFMVETFLMMEDTI